MIKEIKLPKFIDERGVLTYFENDNQIPFVIQNVSWIYNNNLNNSSYELINTDELIISINGCFELILNDGKKEHKFNLACPSKAIYLPKFTYKKFKKFSKNSVVLVCSLNELK